MGVAHSSVAMTQEFVMHTFISLSILSKIRKIANTFNFFVHSRVTLVLRFLKNELEYASKDEQHCREIQK